MKTRKVTDWEAEEALDEAETAQAQAEIKHRHSLRMDRFGLARDRYVSQEELEWRKAVRKIGSEIIESECELMGWKNRIKLPDKLSKYDRQIDRYCNCRSEYLKLKCWDCHRNWIGPARCECRACPHCAKRQGMKIKRKWQSPLMNLQPKRGRALRLLTVTIKTPDDLADMGMTIHRIFAALKKLMSRYYPKDLGCGGLAVMEIGQNNNVHIHVILYGYYVPHRKLSQYWLELTSDSLVIDIRTAHSPKKCLGYLLKYVCKPVASDDPGWIAYYIYWLIGKRRIHSFGVFYKLPVGARIECPCPYCGGRLAFNGTNNGELLPLDARFLSEAIIQSRAA